MKRHSFGITAAILLLFLARVGAAQNAATSELRQVIGTIRPNTLLRIETTGVHTGRLASTSSDSLVLREDAGPTQLGIVDIRSIAESQRHIRHDAIMGGIFGGVGFGAIGLITGGAVCGNSDCQTSHLGGLVAGGVLGLIGGSIGGAAIGLTQRGWRFLYPVPE
jgi:hypothetical protein